MDPSSSRRRPRPLSDIDKTLPPLPNTSMASLPPPIFGHSSTHQSISSDTSETTVHQRPLTLENDLAKWFTNRFAPPRPSTTVNDSAIEKPDDVPKGTGSASDPYIVNWSPGDPGNPYNWRRGFKWALTAHLAINCLAPVYTSSSYVAGVEDLIVKFPGTSAELGIAGLSLYLLGQAFGPLIWAPLSEVESIGRRLTFLVSFPAFVLFNLAGAVSQNMASILVTRFFAGIFGSAHLSNLAGQMADIWVPHERVVPGGLAALSPLLGPVLGSAIGGFVAQKAGWRALFWIQFGFGLVMLILWVFLVPETYAPTLIARKTRLLQGQANNAGTGKIYASKHAGNRKKIWQTLKTGLCRPFILLFTEVIVLTLSLYTCISSSQPSPFPSKIFDTGLLVVGLTGLALFGIGIGMVIGFLLNGVGAAIYAKARARLPPGQLPPPEVRLPTMILGGALVPIGLFIFAWTATPDVHWAVPVVFSSFFGMGYLLIFTSILLYLIDSYSLHAASAVAANSVMRCTFGAAFPLFARDMFEGLGVHWAGSLLGLLALACVPFPVLFYRYGPHLRRKSKYAPSSPSALEMPKYELPGTGTTPALAVEPNQDSALRHPPYSLAHREKRESLISTRAPSITAEHWSPPGNGLDFPQLEVRLSEEGAFGTGYGEGLFQARS